ncbi:hypothetical protein [Nostoc sp.]|uniref:hypothetical protein n=1 Tax=Nostoc sp. TaxID=1180 RepID=UPI002FF8EC4C
MYYIQARTAIFYPKLKIIWIYDKRSHKNMLNTNNKIPSLHLSLLSYKRSRLKISLE